MEKEKERRKYKDEFINRFWKKVNIKDENNCWEWTASIQSKGYGSVGIGKGKTALAHRVAYAITDGTIPEGMQVLHKCDNKKCVNPTHLYLGSHQDNMNDMVERGRQAKGERNGKSKLTNKKVKIIRDLHKSGKYSYGHIANHFGVSQSSVRKIVKGEYWKLPLAE